MKRFAFTILKFSALAYILFFWAAVIWLGCLLGHSLFLEIKGQWGEIIAILGALRPFFIGLILWCLYILATKILKW